MIHLTIDPQTDVALKLIEFLETQPFITIVKEPSEDTIQALEDARQGKLNAYSSSDELFKKLMKDAGV
jgi:hypothetical protein